MFVVRNYYRDTENKHFDMYILGVQDVEIVKKKFGIFKKTIRSNLVHAIAIDRFSGWSAGQLRIHMSEDQMDKFTNVTMEYIEMLSGKQLDGDSLKPKSGDFWH